jgi:hypothetical protein
MLVEWRRVSWRKSFVDTALGVVDTSPHALDTARDPADTEVDTVVAAIAFVVVLLFHRNPRYSHFRLEQQTLQLYKQNIKSIICTGIRLTGLRFVERFKN